MGGGGNGTSFINNNEAGSGGNGAQGPQGPGGGGAGTQGVQGPQGTNPGVQGPQGSGSQGFQGNQGITGAGVQGPQGNIGTQGNQGITGSGAQGAQGNQGLAGVGTQGNQGALGPQGNQGITGAGVQGPQGTGGVQGNQGFQGTSGAGAAAIFQNVQENTLGTTDATPTVILSETLPNPSVGTWRVVVDARYDDGSQHASFIRTIHAYNEGAGAVLGTENADYTEDPTFSLVATYTNSGNDIQVTVIGVVATNITWKARMGRVLLP